jgi:acyl-CoA synthetase (AMP-forming)/AMP-acid ligase II
MMANREIAVTAAQAGLRSGLVRPIGLRTTARLAGAVRRGGTNPATLLAMAAARWPARAAIVDELGAASYLQLQSTTDSLALDLRDRGVGPGRAVGILCRNGRGFAQGVFAAASTGADVVLLNTDFRTDALQAALASHAITTVVCDTEFAVRSWASPTPTTGSDSRRSSYRAAVVTSARTSCTSI